MIRLVAIDVDGTLLNSRHEVTRATAAAIERVRRAGVEVVLTTSRPPRALWPVLDLLALVEPAEFIASQGALTGRYSAAGELWVIDRRPMPVGLAKQVAATGSAAGMSVNWYAAERWLVEGLDDLIREESAIVGCAPDVADLSRRAWRGPTRSCCWSRPSGRTSPTLVAIPEGLVALASTPTHLEVTRADVDKGDALRRLCARRGLRPDEVAAIGDGRNDLGMLAFAGDRGRPRERPPRGAARSRT